MVGLVIFWVIAGRDVIFAFKRFFNRKGCFVFIVNSARTVEKYFLTPKNNVFRISGNLYATNPKKCLNLQEKYLSKEEKKKILDAITNRENDLKEQIKKIEERRKELEVYQTKLKGEQKERVMQTILALSEKARELEKKISERDENYFFRSRATFFYIEGDPVPKDFYEFYSELDSKIIDNLAARAASSSAKMKGSKDYEFMRWLAIAAAIAAVVAALLAFRNQTILTTIAQKLGAEITL
jgi:hypothetical protein